MSRVLRCAACTKRIKPHHPHIGLIDPEAGGGELSYHARCQEGAALETAGRLERGKVYILRQYHHGSACPDEHPGFGCSGGCFDGFALTVAN